MELVIAIALGVLIAGIVLQVPRIPSRLAQSMIRTATAGLPDPLRARVAEECGSEIKATRNAFGKVYIAATCFLDAARLQRLWRTERLRRLKIGPVHTKDVRKDRESERFTQHRKGSDMNGEPAQRLAQIFDATRDDSQKVPWKFRLSMYLNPKFHEPRYRNCQKLFKTCHGKVFRLEGGVWTTDW
jgi:hypothetical protein